MKIYFLYHAAVGQLAQFPMAEPPSEEQVDRARAVFAKTHGEGHAKYNDPSHPSYRADHPLNGSKWDMRVDEVVVVDAATMLSELEAPAIDGEKSGSTELVLPPIVPRVRATVTNP